MIVSDVGVGLHRKSASLAESDLELTATGTPVPVRNELLPAAAVFFG